MSDVATRAQRRTRLIRRRIIPAVVAVLMISLAVTSVALVRSIDAEREASQQRDALSQQSDALRATTEQLQTALAKGAQQTFKIYELLEEAEIERDHARQQKAAAERASEQAQRERDNARRQTEETQRAKDRATAAERQAQIEKVNAERAAEAANEASAKEAEAAARVRQSEQEKKAIIDRAVGPMQSNL